jgi:aminoglycoside/choline kinase family phosphotransferase
MQTEQIISLITAEIIGFLGQPPTAIDTLPASGSQRRYFRLHFAENINKNSDKNAHSLIAAYNENIAENQLFIAYTNHFLAQKIAVPTVLYVSPDKKLYFQQDLGDISLLSYLDSLENTARNEAVDTYYKKALTDLAFIQCNAGKSLDFSLANTHTQFDKVVMGWDLSYFKYWFLMPSRITYDEYRLEQDFQHFLSQLNASNTDFFLFRDFQARNIMLKPQENQPDKFDLYYIDYQGARQGALSYDVASLLYQAKANLSDTQRSDLFEHYLSAVAALPNSPNTADLRAEYPNYVLLRLLQVLGSYGFRGFYERKPHFLSSIPYALRNIEQLMQTRAGLFAAMPELSGVLTRIIERFLHGDGVAEVLKA